MTIVKQSEMHGISKEMVRAIREWIDTKRHMSMNVTSIDNETGRMNIIINWHERR
jgi:hypothetical protein